MFHTIWKTAISDAARMAITFFDASPTDHDHDKWCEQGQERDWAFEEDTHACQLGSISQLRIHTFWFLPLRIDESGMCNLRASEVQHDSVPEWRACCSAARRFLEPAFFPPRLTKSALRVQNLSVVVATRVFVGGVG